MPPLKCYRSVMANLRLSYQSTWMRFWRFSHVSKEDDLVRCDMFTTKSAWTFSFDGCFIKGVWKSSHSDHYVDAIDAREVSEGAKSSGVENRKPPINPIDDNRNTPPNANALVAKGPEEFTIRWAYCGSLHYSASCDKVFNCESRKKVLANSNRYFNCLRKGHNDSRCMSEKNCRNCKKRHHQSMWSSSHKGKRINDQRICGQRNKQYENERDNDYDQREYTTTQKLCFYKQHELWHSKKGKISTPVRILFDTGSQRTYVTENLRSKLKSVQHERLNLNTFGEARYKSQNCDFVHLRLKRPGSGNDETIDISALTFPGICSPLP